MPRKNRNAKRQFDTRISFNELSRKIGLTTKQRIIMRRHILKNDKWKGGEDK